MTNNKNNTRTTRTRTYTNKEATQNHKTQQLDDQHQIANNKITCSVSNREHKQSSNTLTEEPRTGIPHRQSENKKKQ